MSEPQGQPSKSGASGLISDTATLLATGLLAANVLAIIAGLINFLGSPKNASVVGFKFSDRLLNLTATVDVGDIALVAIAMAILILTPDPPGGIPRKLLLHVATGVAGIISIFGVIRALTVLMQSGPIMFRFAGFVATVGLTLAALTAAAFALKEASTRDMSDTDS